MIKNKKSALSLAHLSVIALPLILETMQEILIHSDKEVKFPPVLQQEMLVFLEVEL